MEKLLKFKLELGFELMRCAIHDAEQTFQTLYIYLIHYERKYLTDEQFSYVNIVFTVHINSVLYRLDYLCCWIYVDIQLDMFDRIVLPILAYRCKIWAPLISDIYVKLQLKFYKMILKVRNSCVVLGECGCLILC